MPVTGPDGLPISYKTQHIQSGNQLYDEETLEGADVKSNDTLRLVPEMIAVHKLDLVEDQYDNRRK